MKKLFAAAGLTALLTLTACSQSAAPQTIVTVPSDTSGQQTVTVNSIGSVTVVPDIAEIILSVQSEAADAAACQQDNITKVDQVTARLKELGVDEASIQTTGYYMNPRYDWSNNTQTLIGYETITTLTVSDLPINQTGDILSQAVDAGANQIQSISYLSSQYDAAYQEALSIAAADAQAKAQAMAEAAGLELGILSDMQETSGYSEARYSDNAAREMLSSKEAAADISPVTIMPGELEVKASVMVEFWMYPAQ